MSTEIIFIAGSSIAGAISAALLEKLARSKTDEKKIPNINKPYNTTRAELTSLHFEKTLVSESITRIYEAFQQNQIDRAERDRLLLQYRQQLDSLNQKIAHLQPITDYTDLLELRKNLLSLVEQKIHSLDEKIAEISMGHGIARSNVDQKAQKIISETLKAQAPSVEHLPFKKEESSIEQLQNEIMQALERLEQVESDNN